MLLELYFWFYIYKTKTVVFVSLWLQLICSEIMCRRSWKFTEEAGLFLRRILLDFCLSSFIIIRNILRAVIIIFFLSIWSSCKYQYDRCLWWQLPQNVFLLNTANLKDPSSGHWQVGSYINFKQQLKPVSFLLLLLLNQRCKKHITREYLALTRSRKFIPRVSQKSKSLFVATGGMNDVVKTSSLVSHKMWGTLAISSLIHDTRQALLAWGFPVLTRNTSWDDKCPLWTRTPYDKPPWELAQPDKGSVAGGFMSWNSSLFNKPPDIPQ